MLMGPSAWAKLTGATIQYLKFLQPISFQPKAMASNLIARASHLMAMASNHNHGTRQLTVQMAAFLGAGCVSVCASVFLRPVFVVHYPF